MATDKEPGTSLEQRREFGAVETTLGVVETAGTAAAAKAKAAVEARYVMAIRNPRNLDQVRQDLLAECRRPAFAQNKSAIYNKPIGGGVEGLGIRFVEVALRCMRNIMVESELVFEDETKEVHRVSITDLEANLTYPADVRVSKTVERSKPMDDGSYISVRKNSYNKDVFTVPATDDDLLNKRGALISKAIRTLGLRIIPGDFQDEAEDVIRDIRKKKAAEDPAGERKKIADAFAGLAVKVTDLEAYLGHKLDACSPSELVTLRGMYGAIRDGEATWKSFLDQAGEDDGGENKKKDPATTESGRKKPVEKGGKRLRRLFDENSNQLGEGEVTAVGDVIKLGIVEYNVIELTENNAVLRIRPPSNPAPAAKPAAESKGEPLASPAQLEQIGKKLDVYEITKSELCAAFKIASLENLPARLVHEAIKWIGNPMDDPNLQAE